jgi:DNA mismatch endonuclease (patch repair protein)
MLESRGNGIRSSEDDFRYEAIQPSPDPFTIAERSEIMRKVKSRDTAPEIQLRKALWRIGLRYRLNAKDLPGKPDIVFRGDKLAVFVDGEFWHGKKLSAERLSQMKPYWRQKIDRNVKRDQAVNEALTQSGWRVIRVGTKLINGDRSGIAHLISNLLRGEDVPIIQTGVELYRPTTREASVDA